MERVLVTGAGGFDNQGTSCHVGLRPGLVAAPSARREPGGHLHRFSNIRSGRAVPLRAIPRAGWVISRQWAQITDHSPAAAPDPTTSLLTGKRGTGRRRRWIW